MDFLKSVLAKFGAGILYGAGFLVGAIIIGKLVMPYFQESIAEDTEDQMASMFIEYDESAMLTTNVTKEFIGDGEFTILGNVENKGDETWSMVNLKAELYDANGEFIEECTEYVNQTSRPNTSINFKLSCGSKCSKLQLEQYHSYKLLITDARHKRI